MTARSEGISGYVRYALAAAAPGGLTVPEICDALEESRQRVYYALRTGLNEGWAAPEHQAVRGPRNTHLTLWRHAPAIAPAGSPEATVVISAYTAGATISDAARQAGVSPDRARGILLASRIPLRGNGRPPRRPLPTSDIQARYRAGESAASIAKGYGVSWEVIAGIVEFAGLPVRDQATARQARRAWKPGEPSWVINTVEERDRGESSPG